MAQMPQLGSRWPEWAGWVSFKLCFARAALEQGFVPTSPTARHENGASLVYGCDFTHPGSQAKCAYRFKLVWDDGAGEDVVVGAQTMHDHPLDALDPMETRARTEQIVAELRAEQDKRWDLHCQQGAAYVRRIEEAAALDQHRRQAADSDGGSTLSTHSRADKRARASSDSSFSVSPPSPPAQSLPSPPTHASLELPELNDSFPDVDSFRNTITAFASEQGFKAWVAGGAHGAPRCRMICSISRKAGPGETKCGFSVSVRQTAPGDVWIVDEVEPQHTHPLFLGAAGSVEGESPAPRSVRQHNTPSEAGSVKRKQNRGSSKPKPKPQLAQRQPSEPYEEDEMDVSEMDRQDEDGVVWTPRAFSIRDTEKIARLNRKPPLLPVASFNSEASFSVLAIRIGASAIAEGFHVMPMLCDDKDYRQLSCTARGCHWVLTVRKRGNVWRREGSLGAHSHPTKPSAGSPGSSSRGTGRDDDDDDEGEDEDEDVMDRSGKRGRRDSNATTATGAETDDSRSASGAPRGGGSRGGPAPTSRPIVKLEAVDDDFHTVLDDNPTTHDGLLSRLRGHFRGYDDSPSHLGDPNLNAQWAAGAQETHRLATVRW